MHTQGNSVQSKASAPLRVLVTVDTESYARGDPDKQIWGKVANGDEYGINRIMAILEKYGARGTFYVNVYEAPRVGEAAIQHVVRAIHKRGHDVQLHTHPRDKFGNDKMCRVDLAKQQEILLWGKDFIEKETGEKVLAHRAGAFAANVNTIQALSQVGIQVDASLSPSWRECDLAREVTSRNRPFDLNGVLELPVTYYIQGRLGTKQYLRLVDIGASSLRELKSVVRQAQSAHVTSINFLMHSHSFVHKGQPDLALVKRFDQFVEFLNRQPGVTISTTTQFYDEWKTGRLTDKVNKPFLPVTGWWLTYLRIVESAGKNWKNALVAILPPIVALATVALLLIAAG